MSQYYAVTSLTGEEGTWFIVADGPTFQGVLEVAAGVIAGGNAALTEETAPLVQFPAVAMARHLRVYLKPRAVHLCGSRGIQQYEALTQGVTPGINSSGGGGGTPAQASRPLAGPMPTGGLSRYMASAGAYSAAGVVAVNGTGVYQWNDQVGATNTGQSTAAAQPTFRVEQTSGSAAGCQPGYDAAISFDGTDDTL
ncbi:MAG: hypothetical protein LC772_02125, partial [Chloroflexi bacterium]|nr:hypothetical protein [Chloroflexota bacterium]